MGEECSAGALQSHAAAHADAELPAVSETGSRQGTAQACAQRAERAYQAPSSQGQRSAGSARRSTPDHRTEGVLSGKLPTNVPSSGMQAHFGDCFDGSTGAAKGRGRAGGAVSAVAIQECCVTAATQVMQVP